MNTPKAELFAPREGDELRLSEGATLQVTGYVENPLPGQATIVFLVIQPDQRPIMKSVNMEIRGSEAKGGERGKIPFSVERSKNVPPPKIVIKVLREQSDGELCYDVLTIEGGV